MITNTFSFPAKYSTDSWENKSTENICKLYVSLQIFTFAKNAYKAKNLLKRKDRWREWGGGEGEIGRRMLDDAADPWRLFS